MSRLLRVSQTTDGAKSRSRKLPGILLAVIGLMLMGFGVYRGEMAVVLEKAVNICMECVGIG